ncbi:Valine--tRNA ligase [Nitrospira japonica]|uniref:Valine--tRNA ligase n=2 Tax=Nitrospira japonica TaxID=1325564 RepID=A0A1W1I811_9BACT|nr:Valine--tRNA ligase [Nitrospira japonica]
MRMLRCPPLITTACMTTRQLDKTYDPKAVEARWYHTWIDRGYFHASPDHPGVPYSIVIPPPNVTGSLHVGHALNHSLQDILIRWRRMQGRNTLWLPGTDHAGIATQNVVEKQLLAEGSSRDSLGRDRFIERIWQWKATSGNKIISQQKQLGESCDWNRLRFTMDDGLSKAVIEVFVRLHEDGLMYRGERLINWCPRCLTALSDIEVEHEEIKGKLYHIRYPLADDPTAHLTVATTRPETLLGDMAVAVHPEDSRHNRLVGRHVLLPLTTRRIPVVADPILVDLEFGTGAVKITPAHDFNDFEAGERHRLSRLSLYDEQAKMASSALRDAEVEENLRLQLEMKPVQKARTLVVAALTDRGLLEKTEDHKMALGHCYRCKTIVEPYLSPQWFVKIHPLAEPAIKAVETGAIRIIPEGWKNNYLGWMREIKDWCVSRQIWWGHQIPAWYCLTCNADSVLTRHTQESTDEAGKRERIVITKNARPIVARSAPTTCPTCGGTNLLRDPDVLDTWFSSGLWPFSTLGWPEQTPELKTYYPTSTLVTGLDILFFWVARMIMLGLKFMGDVPFRDVYIHALVRDAEGQKMSKSKGNVIDPLHVMDQFGTDALRFTLASMASPGRDVRLAEERIEGYRNFANKIWNAARFAHMHLDKPRMSKPVSERSFPDRWIISRLNHTVRLVNDELDAYRFDRAALALYQFMWHEYCDWYLELIKPALQDTAAEGAETTRQTLAETLEIIMRLLHPFMPFITEEIWQALPHEGDSVMTRPYPAAVAAWAAPDMEENFALLEQTVSLLRTARVLLTYPPAQPIRFAVTHDDPARRRQVEALHPHIAHLGRGVIEQDSGGSAVKRLRMVTEGLTVAITVADDVDVQKALDRLLKQTDEQAKEIGRLEGKLGNADFTAKAPPEVIADHQQRLRTLRGDQTILASSAAQLRAMLEA